MSIKDAVNEGSTPTITIEFLDEAGDPVVPTAASFSIVDVTSGTVIKAEDDFETIAASIDLQLDSDDTQILNAVNAYEDRRILINYEYGVEKLNSVEYFYTVKNLSNIVDDSTLIIEDGTIVSNAESYATIAEIRAYALKRGITLSTNDMTLKTQCQLAMDYLESIRDKYQGTKVDDDQELQFPRSDVYIDGVLQDYETIPGILKKAQCQLIMEINNNVILMPTRNKANKKSTKVGPIETEYFDTVPALPSMTAVFSLLDPLFKKSSAAISVLRA